MQLGFAWLEAGAIRRKNAGMVYQKITLNSLITVFSMWVLGYAFGFGDADGARFIGAYRFFAGSKWDDMWDAQMTQYTHWVMQTCIAAVVPAITGGVVAERITLLGTSIHTLFMTMFIYPFILSWTWGGGWLHTTFNYKDFTGSGIVHCTGAYAGLACLFVVGPRYGQYGYWKNVMGEENRVQAEEPKAFTYENVAKLRKRVNEDGYEKIGPSDIPVMLQGALFLWFGFLYFNGGSSLLMQDTASWVAAEKGFSNTFFAGLGGAIPALALKHPLINGWKAKRNLKADAGTVANAYLGGMVANGAGMDVYQPFEAILVGMCGGLVYTLLCVLFEKLHLDDALEAFQLHGGCGTTGVLAAAFFRDDVGVFHVNPGSIIADQLFCWFMISLWSFGWSFIIFTILNKAGILRVDLKTEIVGYDYIDDAGHLDIGDRKLEKSGNTKVEHSSGKKDIEHQRLEGSSKKDDFTANKSEF